MLENILYVLMMVPATTFGMLLLFVIMYSIAKALGFRQ